MKKEDLKHVTDLCEACHENQVSLDSVMRVLLEEVANMGDEEWEAKFGQLVKVAIDEADKPLEDNAVG